MKLNFSPHIVVVTVSPDLITAAHRLPLQLSTFGVRRAFIFRVILNAAAFFWYLALCFAASAAALRGRSSLEESEEDVLSSLCFGKENKNNSCSASVHYSCEDLPETDSESWGSLLLLEEVVQVWPRLVWSQDGTAAQTQTHKHWARFCHWLLVWCLMM